MVQALRDFFSDGHESGKKEKLILTIVFSVIAFVLPFLLLIFCYKANGYSPWGEDTVIMIDMQSEYIGYLRYYKSILLGDGSMIYNSAKVFGGDFFSIFTFYLASPLNLFCVFVDDADLPMFFMWVNFIKMSLAGVNMYSLFRYTTHKNKIGYLAFAVGYALISYSTIYFSNFMWLDGVMILPLVILGLELLKENRARWLYPLALCFAMMTSWYIGAMICIFVVFFFLYQFFSSKFVKEEKIPYLIRFALSSLIGGLLAGFLWITAFLHFSGTKATSNFPEFEVFSLSMFFTGFLENGYDTVNSITIYWGYISMFTSVITLVFYQLFFFNKHFTVRERIFAFSLLFVYFLAAMINTIGTLFHGGREPTWFPSRYSFVIGFLVCYFGGKEFDHLEDSPVWSALIPIVVSAIVLPIVTLTANNLKEGYQYYQISAVSLFMYLLMSILVLGYLLVRFRKPTAMKRLPSMALGTIAVMLASISSYRGTSKIISTNVEENVVQKYSTYLEDDKYQSDFDKVKEYAGKDSVYRMESTFNRPGAYNSIDNNPMFYRYNGLSHFSSSEKKDVEEYMLKIGFHYNGFFEKYDGGSTASINAFLGLKYLIDDTSDTTTDKPQFMSNAPFTEITSLTSENDGIEYYENTLALPLGFTINSSDPEKGATYISEGSYREDGTVHWYDHFEYQNEMFKCLTDKVVDENGKKKDIFHKINAESISPSAGVTITQDEYGDRKYTCSGSSQHVTMKFTVPEEAYGKNLYFCEKSCFDKATYYLDGRQMRISTYWNKGIRGFKDTATHSHTLSLNFTSQFSDKEIREEIYYEDTDVLKEYIDAIKDEAANDLKQVKSMFSYGYEGSFTLNEDNRDFMFTLPEEKEIKVYVDGKKVKTFTRYNIFTAIDLDGYEKGTHTIRIVYTDSGLILGAGVTLFSIIAFINMMIYYPRFETWLIAKLTKKKEPETQE